MLSAGGGRLSIRPWRSSARGQLLPDLSELKENTVGIYLATEHWLDHPGDETGLIDQFASTGGYSDLIAAASVYPALSDFFKEGFTEDVEQVRAELAQLIPNAAPDVASTAGALWDLAKGHDFLIITDGVTGDGPWEPDERDREWLLSQGLDPDNVADQRDTDDLTLGPDPAAEGKP